MICSLQTSLFQVFPSTEFPGVPEQTDLSNSFLFQGVRTGGRAYVHSILVE